MCAATTTTTTVCQDLKVHIANLNVSMTSTDATNVQKQTEGTRVLAELMGTPLPYAPLDLVLRNRSCPTPIEVHCCCVYTAHARARRNFSCSPDGPVL